MTVWAKTRLVFTSQYFEKYHFKNSIKKPALPWYWSHSLSIIILSYLLAFVQLTWQVNNGWFLAVFMIFSRNSLILGQCILGGGWWQKINQRRKKTQTVEFRVAMTRTCTHERDNIPLQGLYRQTCTDSGSHIRSHSQLGALLWRHFTSRRHGEQKAFRESRPVDISQWRQWTCIVI